MPRSASPGCPPHRRRPRAPSGAQAQPGADEDRGERHHVQRADPAVMKVRFSNARKPTTRTPRRAVSPVARTIRRRPRARPSRRRGWAAASRDRCRRRRASRRPSAPCPGRVLRVRVEPGHRARVVFARRHRPAQQRPRRVHVVGLVEDERALWQPEPDRPDDEGTEQDDREELARVGEEAADAAGTLRTPPAGGSGTGTAAVMAWGGSPPPPHPGRDHRSHRLEG